MKNAVFDKSLQLVLFGYQDIYIYIYIDVGWGSIRSKTTLLSENKKQNTFASENNLESIRVP